MFLFLVDSPEVLKLYKYIFDIQRLVDPPIWKLFSRGERKMQMGRLVSNGHWPLAPTVDGNVHPWTQAGSGVEWQDPVNLANARVPSLLVTERGWSGNF